MSIKKLVLQKKKELENKAMLCIGSSPSNKISGYAHVSFTSPGIDYYYDESYNKT